MVLFGVVHCLHLQHLTEEQDYLIVISEACLLSFHTNFIASVLFKQIQNKLSYHVGMAEKLESYCAPVKARTRTYPKRKAMSLLFAFRALQLMRPFFMVEDHNYKIPFLVLRIEQN